MNSTNRLLLSAQTQWSKFVEIGGPNLSHGNLAVPGIIEQFHADDVVFPETRYRFSVRIFGPFQCLHRFGLPHVGVL